MTTTLAAGPITKLLIARSVCPHCRVEMSRQTALSHVCLAQIKASTAELAAKRSIPSPIARLLDSQAMKNSRYICSSCRTEFPSEGAVLGHFETNRCPVAAERQKKRQLEESDADDDGNGIPDPSPKRQYRAGARSFLESLDEYQQFKKEQTERQAELAAAEKRYEELGARIESVKTEAARGVSFDTLKAFFDAWISK